MKKFSRIWIIILLFLATFVNALDRTNISVSSTAMMKDLHINPSMMGVILSSFFWAYMIGNIPAGSLADRYGSKKVYAISATIWSVATALTGAFRSLPAIIVMRLGVGAGEAAAFPIGTKVVNENFSAEERGTATGIYIAGLRLGMAVAPVAVAWILTKYGWEMSFYITGILSLLWVLLWVFTYPKDKKENLKSAEQVKKFDWVAFKRLISKRNTIAVVFIKFFQDYLFYLFVTWLPGYLIMQRHFTIMKMGIFASLPWIVGMFAQPLFGMLSDWMVRRGFSRTVARKLPIVVCQLLAGSVILTGYIQSPLAAVWLCVLGVAAESGSTAVLWTIPAELAEGGEGATLGGVMNTAGALAGILSPIVTGMIVTSTNSFNSAFAIAGVGIVLAALCVIFFLGKIDNTGSNTKETKELAV